MRITQKTDRVSAMAIVFGVCAMLLFPIGITERVMAGEESGELEQIQEGAQEDDVTTRGIRGQKSRAFTNRSRSMTKPLPSTKQFPATGHKQIQALQNQVNTLRAQVNALRAVIQVSNGVTTLQSKHIRIQGDTVIVKSLKDYVTIESKKNLKLESRKDMAVKAASKIQVDAGNSLSLRGNGTTNIRGGIVKLNNGSKPVASIGSRTLSGPVGGPGKVTSGSPKVLVP